MIINPVNAVNTVGTSVTPPAVNTGIPTIYTGYTGYGPKATAIYALVIPRPFIPFAQADKLFKFTKAGFWT